ncbi:MAG: hypothetical protein M3Y72_04215, partial [Acidobacteriota bacterium]|nr:hypothetical protein [Acidobacteriota bacterium]
LDVNTTPEPGTIFLCGGALILAWACLRRRAAAPTQMRRQQSSGIGFVEERHSDVLSAQLRAPVSSQSDNLPHASASRKSRLRGIVTLLFVLFIATNIALAGTAVVTHGKITNVYVYPTPSWQTWEQHMESLRPADADRFSRASIDQFTDQIMKLSAPSYFDALFQYSGIHPPDFFGSGVASQKCVDAALKDAYHSVLQWDTIRSLSNCHASGMDPSPQLNLIFSPDIKVAKITFPAAAHGPDMCTDSPAFWLAWFTVLPTSTVCEQSFEGFTETMTHEIVEMLSDPGGFGLGTFPKYTDEIADICKDRNDAITIFEGFTVTRYLSQVDNTCQPRSNPTQRLTPQSVHTWLDASDIPLVRFSGQVHDFAISVKSQDVGLDLRSLDLVIGTGNDDLRGGSNYEDNCNVTLELHSGQTITLTNVNGGNSWPGWTTHTVSVPLSNFVLKGGDIKSIMLHTNFGGGLSGDNWNVNRVQLIASLAASSSMFVSRSVPGTMLQSQSYPVSITFANTGLGKWSTTTAHSLGAQNPQDNTVWWFGRVPLPQDVFSGESVTFNFIVTPPFKAGVYNFQWRMVQDGVEWFGGQSPNVVITVPENTACGPIHTQIGADRSQIQALLDELKTLDIKFPGDRARIKEIHAELAVLSRDIQSLYSRGNSLGCIM